MSTSVKADRLPRVGIVYRLERAGGVQSCAFAIIRALNKRGIIPDILWDTPPNPKLLQDVGVKAGYRKIPFNISSRIIDRLPFTLRYLANISNGVDGSRLKDEYDFFYVFYNGFLLPPDFPHVRFLSGPPLIPQLKKVSKGIRGMPMRSFQWLYGSWLRKVAPVYEFHKQSPYVINAQFTAQLFQEAHGIVLPVVNPPIDIPERSFADEDWQTRDSITFFSRIIDYKRPDWVLQLAQRYPDLRCVIMGGVPEHRRAYFEALQEKAKAMGLKQVVFLDNPPTPRVKEELSRTRYYVFPARNEHFGMTTVEAIAAGALPFVHDSGGQREIVPDERLRFDDPHFAEKFDALIQLPVDEINATRRRLFEHVGQFSESVFVSKMLAYLPELNENPPSPPAPLPEGEGKKTSYPSPSGRG